MSLPRTVMPAPPDPLKSWMVTLPVSAVPTLTSFPADQPPRWLTVMGSPASALSVYSFT